MAFQYDLIIRNMYLFRLADNIPSSLWLDRVLDDQSTERLLAFRHVPHALHADSARCSVSRSLDRCRHLCPGNFNMQKRIFIYVTSHSPIFVLCVVGILIVKKCSFGDVLLQRVGTRLVLYKIVRAKSFVQATEWLPMKLTFFAGAPHFFCRGAAT